MLPLGTKAPEFNLNDTVTDKSLDLQELKGSKGTVILFICNHCPHVHAIEGRIRKFVDRYQGRGVAFCAVNSNNEIDGDGNDVDGDALTPADEPAWFAVTVIPLPEDHVVVQFRSITHYKNVLRQAVEMMNHDDLTGLALVAVAGPVAAHRLVATHRGRAPATERPRPIP